MTSAWISAPWFWPLVAALVLLGLVLWVVWPVRRRTRHDELSQTLQPMLDRLDREWRDELARSASATRQDLTASLAAAQQSLLAQASEVARTQQEQLDGFRDQLASTQQTLTSNAQAAREAQDAALARASQAQDAALTRASERQASSLERMDTSLAQRMHALSEGNERRLVEVRQSVEARLNALAQTNEAKLEQMRLTVDEKLHATLEQRLGDSFRLVAERLEAVHAGLGEMKKMAADVGSLNRVLTNVKTRGTFGEVQLAGLLEQVLTPEQYAANVETVPGSGMRVEFAIRMPGPDRRDVWLPIDAKFPREDHERLLDAQERADAPAAEAAGKALEARLRLEARTIRDKYIAAPHTVEFGILFLPTEGLYAEALRRPGLSEGLQRDCRVMIAGPTTLLATLNSLQMGFRTLALEQRSTEIRDVLGAVKTEFAKFGEVLERTKRKLDSASRDIEQVGVRSRAMQRELRKVEALPDDRARALLPALSEDESAAIGWRALDEPEDG
jgi:DNA recombination protein RmuC